MRRIRRDSSVTASSARARRLRARRPRCASASLGELTEMLALGTLVLHGRVKTKYHAQRGVCTWVDLKDLDFTMCIEPRARDASSIRAEAAPPAPRLPLRARRATASALSPARDSPPRLRPAPNGPHGPLRPDPPSRGRWGRFARVAARHDRRLRARRVCSAHARGRRHAQPPTTHARNARAARPEPGGYRLTLTGKLSTVL